MSNPTPRFAIGRVVAVGEPDLSERAAMWGVRGALGAFLSWVTRALKNTGEVRIARHSRHRSSNASGGKAQSAVVLDRIYLNLR